MQLFLLALAFVWILPQGQIKHQILSMMTAFDNLFICIAENPKDFKSSSSTSCFKITVLQKVPQVCSHFLVGFVKLLNKLMFCVVFLSDTESVFYS